MRAPSKQSWYVSIRFSTSRCHSKLMQAQEKLGAAAVDTTGLNALQQALEAQKSPRLCPVPPPLGVFLHFHSSFSVLFYDYSAGIKDQVDLSKVD